MNQVKRWKFIKERFQEKKENTLSTEKKVRFKSIRKKEITMTILTKIEKIK